MTPLTHDPASLSPLAEWSLLSEALLRGLVHSVNNRITAIAAFGELAAMGDAEFAPGVVIPTELARLQAVVGQFRLLVSDDALPAAMTLGPVADDAVSLHGHHARLRAVHCSVARRDMDIPVRVPRWALLRLLLVLLEEGKRAAEASGREEAVLEVSGGEQWVELRVREARATAYAVEMARLCGAAGEVGDDVIRIPTLLEVRRQERERRSALVT